MGNFKAKVPDVGAAKKGAKPDNNEKKDKEKTPDNAGEEKKAPVPDNNEKKEKENEQKKT